MSWVTAGVAAASIATSLYTSSQQNDATRDASRGATDRIEGGVARANELLSPYILSSEAANRQLMIEMGLGGTLRERDITSISNLESQIEALRNAPPPQIKEEGGGAGGGGGWLGGAIGGALGGLVGDPVTGILAGHVKGGEDSYSTGNYDAEIAELEAQLATEKEAYAAAGEYAPTNAYMDAPGYQGAIDAGTQAVNTGAANAGALYSGSRGKALKDVGQSVQQSYYSNYMNMLQNLANPSTATNLANINIGAQGSIANQNIASTNLINENRGALTADIVGGLTSAGGAYLNRQSAGPAAQPQAPQTSGGPVNPVDYSGYV